MVIPVPSRQERFKLRIGIRAYEPCALVVKCHDATKPNTDYIRRRVAFHPELFTTNNKGYKELVFPFPLSPDQLMVELYDKTYGDDNYFKIEKFEVEKITPRELWAEPEVHRFIDFAQDFVVKAGYLHDGVYDSSDGDFMIQYLPVITDEFGRTLVTPARTNRHSGRIQVSRSAFSSYSIPVRMAVLFHERYHFQLPTRKEIRADLHGIRICLDLGFPRIETIYATTKIFGAHPESVGPAHVERVKAVFQFMEDYSKKHNLKINEF